MIDRQSVEIGRRTLLTGAVGAGAALAQVRLSPHRAQNSAKTYTSNIVPKVTGRVVKVSDFGFDPDDSTRFLQAALDHDAETVIVDKMPGQWLTGPLFINRNNITVLFEPAVVMRAKPGAFPRRSDALITVGSEASSARPADSNRAITLTGYGATLAMNKPEYTNGEWRHLINLRGASNVTIEGLTLRDSGGDGIYVGASNSPGAEKDYCENIEVRNVTCLNNRRNGMSVISVDGLLVEGSSFRQTAGTAPDAGVDFEPNNPSQRLRRVVMRDCLVDDNLIYGVVVALTNLNSSSKPVDILFDRITIGSTNSQTPTFTFKGSADEDPGGRVIMRDSLIRKSPATGATSSTDKGYVYGGESPGQILGTAMGAVGVFAKPSRGIHVSFERTVVWDAHNPFQFFQPITVSPMPLTYTGKSNRPHVTTEFGGIRWNQCLLVTDTDGPFLAVENETPDSPGLARITGILTVINPNGATMNLGNSPTRVSLRVKEITKPEQALVKLLIDAHKVQAGDRAIVTISREAGNLSYPLAVSYVAAGTVDRYTGYDAPAVPSLDFDGLSGTAIIRPGTRTVRVPIKTRSLADRTLPRTITVTLLPGHGYNLSASPASRSAQVAII